VDILENFFATKRLIITFRQAFYQCLSGVRSEYCRDSVDVTKTQRLMLDLSLVVDTSSVVIDLLPDVLTQMAVTTWGVALPALRC